MSKPDRVLRFTLSRRIEHWTMVVSFVTLALTGLPQRDPNSPISDALIRLWGGIESARVIHRTAAVVLALLAIYHVGTIIHQLYVRRSRWSMLPTLRDVRAGWQMLLVNLGLKKQTPQQGRYTFEEKLEYWSLVWGIGIMVLTGFFLWNPLTAASILPGEFIPAAKAAHGNEALLAVLAVVVWHLYHVIVRHFNRSMFTGFLTRKEMEAEHALELEEAPLPPIDPAVRQRRRQRFLIAYGVVAALWLGSLAWFVTSEQTARAEPIAVSDIQRVESFVPLTPTPAPPPEPTPALAAQLGTSWEDGLGELIVDRCGGCHNARALEAGLDLTTYAAALQGGRSGAAIVPRGPGISPLIIWPQLDRHPLQLGRAELAALRTWIQEGASEGR